MACRFGLFTDAHYSDREPSRGRWYGDSIEKLRAMASAIAAEPLDFVIELGDLVDARPGAVAEARAVSGAADPVVEDLEAIASEYSRLHGERHHVLGNHDVGHLTKADFRAHTGAREAPYAFSRGAVRFVVLDACFLSDGRAYGEAPVDWADSFVPRDQLRWLERELLEDREEACIGTVVFVLQRLDASSEYAVRNAADVRRVLEEAPGPCLVLQGHAHLSAVREIGSVTYVTFQAMVDGPGPENAAFAIVEIDATFRVRIQGQGRQPSHDLDLSRRIPSTRVDADRRSS